MLMKIQKQCCQCPTSCVADNGENRNREFFTIHDDGDAVNDNVDDDDDGDDDDGDDGDDDAREERNQTAHISGGRRWSRTHRIEVFGIHSGELFHLGDKGDFVWCNGRATWVRSGWRKCVKA